MVGWQPAPCAVRLKATEFSEPQFLHLLNGGGRLCGRLSGGSEAKHLPKLICEKCPVCRDEDRDLLVFPERLLFAGFTVSLVKGSPVSS